MDISPRLRRLQSLVGDHGKKLLANEEWSSQVTPFERNTIIAGFDDVQKADLTHVNVRRGKSSATDESVIKALTQFPQNPDVLMLIGKRSESEFALRLASFSIAMCITIANAKGDDGSKVDRSALERFVLGTLASAESVMDKAFG